jgi:predicted Zn finger-like uncharacterized protein
MRIVCPSCDAVYNVPDAMLAAAPRAVRCARCGTEWTPGALADAPPAQPAPPAEPPPPAAVAEPAMRPERAEPKLSSYRSRTEPRLTAVSDLDARPPPRDDETTLRGRRGAVAGWVFSVLLLIGLAAASVAWRTQVMAAWPPSQRVYGALGLR